ncbi:hypothetical protein B296_00047162 [Ensete ventricosum]|uniref:Uncharacterized protein n=1 Tax=Ensete ventricosum TaxID=4639 RepID=A0A426YRX2_ENSVE|nr:hypothetical protein B296_00047162 [Ensete ventricosum]
MSAWPGSSRVRKLTRAGRNWDLRLGLGSSLGSQRLGVSSIVCSLALLRVRTVDPARRSRRGWGVSDVTPPTPELVGFSEKGGELSFYFWRVEPESPSLVLPKGNFILTEGEVAHTFGLTSVVTSGMAKSYDGPIVVWGEDMMRHATFMTCGGGVGMAQRLDLHLGC